MTDWKKAPKSNTWHNIHVPYSVVRCWRIGLTSAERKRRGVGLYGVVARVGLRGRQSKKTFKTKKNALRFAMSYMRMH